MDHAAPSVAKRRQHGIIYTQETFIYSIGLIQLRQNQLKELIIQVPPDQCCFYTFFCLFPPDVRPLAPAVWCISFKLKT